MINREEFEELWQKFLVSLDRPGKDEFYGTERDLAKTAGELFMEFAWPDLQRQQRYLEYLKLKKEFE